MPTASTSTSRRRLSTSEPPGPVAGPSSSGSSSRPSQRRRIDLSSSEPAIRSIDDVAREVIVLSSDSEADSDVEVVRDTGPRRQRRGAALNGDLAPHLAPPVRRPRFSPAPAPPRRSHSPLYPGDIPRRRPNPPPPQQHIILDAGPSNRNTITLSSGSDSDSDIVPVRPARPHQPPGPRGAYRRRLIDRALEVDAFSSTDDDDDLIDEDVDEEVRLEMDYLRQYAGPGGAGGGRPAMWNNLFNFDALAGFGAGGGAGGAEMRRPIGIEQQWRDAGAFAPPEPLPTRRLYSRNCELEVQGVVDSSSEDEEEEVDEEEREVEESLAGSDPVEELKERRRKREENKKKKEEKKKKKGPGPSTTSLTFGCSSCARPLLLSAGTKSRRIWALSCGHLVDGWCLSHLEKPPPGSTPPIAPERVPTKKGKSRAPPKRPVEEWGWVCPVEGCEKEHVSELVWVERVGKEDGEGPTWVARKGEEGVVEMYI